MDVRQYEFRQYGVRQDARSRFIRWLTGLVWLVLPLCASQAGAETTKVYKYLDHNGVLHLTSKPPVRRAGVQIISRNEYALATPETAAWPLPERFIPLPPLAQVAPTAHAQNPYAVLAGGIASKHGLDPALLRAVMRVESNYNPTAVSPKGAQGLMQLMPDTAKRLGVADPFDPLQNMDGGARYLKALLAQFQADVPLALAAYNAGEHAVTRHGNRIPPYPETQGYVQKVLQTYWQEGS